MNDELSKQIAQLRQAFDSGILDEVTYQKLCATLEEQGNPKGSQQEDPFTRSVTVGSDLSKSTVVTGDNNSVFQILKLYRQEEDVTLDEKRLQSQILDYLLWVRDHFGTIEFRGVHREGRQVVQLDLEKIYVPLAAGVSANRTQEISLRNILGLGSRLIVTGGPGSGKTTVLQHVAWTLATAILTDNPTLAQQKLGLPLKEQKSAFNKVEPIPLPLPIYVPLSAYVQARRTQPNASEFTLGVFITRYLAGKQGGFNIPHNFFERLLASGRGVILLLDGMDEVPDEYERIIVREAIENLVTGRDRFTVNSNNTTVEDEFEPLEGEELEIAHIGDLDLPETMEDSMAEQGDIRVIVTCRSAAYRGRAALGKGFIEIKVLPLNDAFVTVLVEKAYWAVYPKNSTLRQAKIDELLAGIRDMETERHKRLGAAIERLIDSPLMVRMLLIVHLSERRLPEHRAELYMRATDTILWPEHTLDVEASERIGRLVGGSHELHRELAQHVAFAMHRQGAEQGREIEESALRRILKSAPEFASVIDDFFAVTRLRGTLLEERMGVYRFIHLAFQEYLVARYLAEIIRGESGVGSIVDFLEDGPMLESWWREPILLVVGYLSLSSPRSARQLLRRLIGVGQEPQKRTKISFPIRITALEIAALACMEWLSTDIPLREELSQHATSQLLDKETNKSAQPADLVVIGEVLAILGDPRSGVGVKDGLPNFEWHLIDVGNFQMGGNGPFDGKLGFVCRSIRQSYYISRYPVTVIQFQSFVNADGYGQSRYWTKAGWSWLTKNRMIGQRLQKDIFDRPNHPKVRVSWYEAVAFCNWMSEQSDVQIRLPTEIEWERAARHSDGRIYPWGNEGLSATHCNIDSTGINCTAAVGLFVKGNAVCGAADMIGNVWEWCSTQWVEDYGNGYELNVQNGLEGEFRRVLRGGSFENSRDETRCATRSGASPSVCELNHGFRVVRSSLMPGRSV